MRRRALCAASVVSGNDEIIFYIDVSSEIEEYRAKDGMTWREWVSSDYNTGGYLINTRYNIISKTSGRVEVGVKYTYYDLDYVSVDDIIENKHEYCYN